MKNTLETRLGMFIAVALIAAFIIIEIIGGPDFFKPAFLARARFADIHELKVGDAVKLAGVPVGRVEKVGLAGGKVEIVLSLVRGTPVHTDTQATIHFAGLMGQDYVSLTFGSEKAPLLEPDGLLPTAEQPDLNALMAKLDDAASGMQNLTKSLTGDKIDNLLGPLTDFLRQNNLRLAAIIGNMQIVSSQVAQGKGTMGKLLFDETLYNTAQATITNLQDTASEIKLTLAQARDVVSQVNSGQGTVGKLVKDEALYREATASMTNLKEIMQKINGGQGTVGKLINDQEFYKNARLSLEKVDKATESLEDAGPLSLIGSIFTTLF